MYIVSETRPVNFYSQDGTGWECHEFTGRIRAEIGRFVLPWADKRSLTGRLYMCVYNMSARWYTWRHKEK